MDNLTFRTTPRASDADAIRDIMKSTGFFDEVDEEIPQALEDFNSVLKGEDRDTIYIFAELDGKVVGYVSFDKAICTDSYYFFEWISVNQNIRGHGIGKRLMFKAFDIIRSLGGRKAYLQTAGRAQYLPTQKFYEKCGYVHEATLKDYYIKGDDCYFYSIDLEKK